MARHRALLPVPDDHPEEGQRLRRRPLRRAASADRLHRQPGLEPHRVDRLPVHAVPAHDRPDRRHALHRRRPVRGDDPEARHGRPRRRQDGIPHALVDALRAGLHLARGRAVAMDECDGVRDEGRERGQLPRLQPLHRDRPRAVHAGVARDPQAVPRDPVGQHDRRRPSGERPLCGHRLDPERLRRPCPGLQHRARPGADIGLPVFDGSRSSCDWQNDPDAVQPGIFGPSHEPYLFRKDYVTNSNDSYWLSNPHQPLEGFARIIGDQRTARSLRTRMGLVGVEEIIKSGGFTNERMRQFEFSDRALSGELSADDAVAMCRRYETLGYAPSSNGPVEVGNACDALAGWDKREDSDSKGALLWRRFWSRASGAAGGPWLPPFAANNPVNTPNTLNTAHPTVNTALGDAISDLRGAKIPFDAPLGSVQYVTRDGERIPIHGGPHGDGVFNVITNSFVAGQDHLAEPVHGSSYIQIVSWNGKRGCPEASTLITYSQSTDPTSPHFADQTRLFSDHGWNHPPFCSSDVKSARGATLRLR